MKSFLQAVQAGIGFSIGPELTLAQYINKNITELDQNLNKLKCIKSGEDQDLTQAIDEYLATSHKKLLNIVLQGMSGMQGLPNKRETLIHFDVEEAEKEDSCKQEELATEMG